MAQALATHPSVTKPLRARLVAYKPRHDNAAEDVAHKFFLESDADYKHQVDALVEVGADGAKRILAKNGVKTRIGGNTSRRRGGGVVRET